MIIFSCATLARILVWWISTLFISKKLSRLIRKKRLHIVVKMNNDHRRLLLKNDYKCSSCVTTAYFT